jgi:hypothetical protein
VLIITTLTKNCKCQVYIYMVNHASSEALITGWILSSGTNRHSKYHTVWTILKSNRKIVETSIHNLVLSKSIMIYQILFSVVTNLLLCFPLIWELFWQCVIFVFHWFGSCSDSMVFLFFIDLGLSEQFPNLIEKTTNTTLSEQFPNLIEKQQIPHCQNSYLLFFY